MIEKKNKEIVEKIKKERKDRGLGNSKEMINRKQIGQ